MPKDQSKKSSSEMTLDKLAAMTQHGFSELHQEFRQELHQEIAGVYARIDSLQSEMHEGFQSLGNSIKYLLSELMEIKEIIEKQHHEERIQNLEKRMKHIEQSIGRSK